MTRILHRWPGLLAALFLVLLALSGAALSVFPAIERASAPSPLASQSVADLAALVLARHPGVEQIVRAPSGKVTVYWFDGDTPGAAVIDPATGQDVASGDPNPVERWLTEFHRSLFLDDNGRLVTAAAAAALLTMAASGAVLVARRAGGWRRWFARQRGPLAGRLHNDLARLAVPVLALTALTALWMTASTFDLLPSDGADPVAPTEVSGLTGMSPAEMTALAAVPVSALRELTFPYADDATDVFTLKTADGTGFLDQGTGKLLSWTAPGPWARVEAWVLLLHTGQGAALWGLLLGLISLTVPVLAVTGTVVWARGRKGRKALPGLVSEARAETVILVASEGGTTWGFATTLAQALQKAGQAVHLGPLSGFAPQRYAAARRVVILAATWGDGAAPAAASGFLDRLAASPARKSLPLAILGFGDKSFPSYCAFAEEIDAVARRGNWPLLLDTGRVNQQSAQDFARWGRDFGQAIGLTLELNHQPAPPRTTGLTLLSRRDYDGIADQGQAAILRFAMPKAGLWQRLTALGAGRFSPGDLLGIVPEGSAVPRFYSLASGSRDGFLEIAVRHHPGGLCSGQLMTVQPGGQVRAFIRRNPGFHPGPGQSPLILIGAGTGIGPLAGFIRANAARRPVHLWFGARHPEADLLYAEELQHWSQDGRLSGMRTAFSRSPRRRHVQDALRQDADAVRALIARGARVMVCGGRDMAQGVRDALADILHPVGHSPVTLTAEGRYVEDVY